MSTFRAGAVRQNITPPLGIKMRGYASRTEGAEAIRDDLHCRTLYLTDGEREALLVGVDNCIMSREPVAAVQERVEALTGIPRDHVVLNLSHTHYGPALEGGELEERYTRQLIDTVAGTAAWARAEARPARLAHGREPVQLGVHRRERTDRGIILGVNWDVPVLPWVDVALLVDESDAAIACLFAHACHPTTMPADCRVITADFPGVAAAMVEAELGGVGLFLQGCCGDINPYPRNEGFEHVDTLGRRLGHAVLKAASELAPGPVERLTPARRRFALPLERELPKTVEEAREWVADREELLAASRAGERRSEALNPWWAERQVRGANEALAMLEQGHAPGGLQFEAVLLALDDLALVGSPAEVLSPLGRAIDARSPYQHTLALGYTNGCFGYLPDAPVWDDEGYEHMARMRHCAIPIARGAGEHMVDQTLALLNETRQPAPA